MSPGSQARAALIPIRAGKFGEWILGEDAGFYLRGRCQGLLAPGTLTLGPVSLNFYACLHEKLNQCSYPLVAFGIDEETESHGAELHL